MIVMVADSIMYEDLNSKDINKLFNKIESLSGYDFRNGETFQCYGECCGCTDCGEHEYTFMIDEDTRIKIDWNNWRNYRNGFDIECYNHERGYWDTIYTCANYNDVTSFKDFWLSEWERKFLLNVNIRAVMQLKEWKNSAYVDKNQTTLDSYLKE